MSSNQILGVYLAAADDAIARAGKLAQHASDLAYDTHRPADYAAAAQAWAQVALANAAIADTLPFGDAS